MHLISFHRLPKEVLILIWLAKVGVTYHNTLVICLESATLLGSLVSAAISHK